MLCHLKRRAVQAEHIESKVREVKSKFKSVLTKPLLVNAVVEDKISQIELFRSQLLSRVDESVHSFIYKRGESALDDTVVPPIRFSELDLIQRSLIGENIRPEIFRHEGKVYINWAEPISDESEIHASALVRTEIATILDGLNDAVSGDGKVVILQKFKNETPKPAYQFGQGSPAYGQIAHVKNSLWQVEFFPSAQLVASMQVNQTLVFSIIAVLLALFVSLGALNGHRIGRKFAIAKAPDQVEGEEASKEQSETQVGETTAQQDVLDIDIVEDDLALLGLEEDGSSTDIPQQSAAPEPEPEASATLDIPEVIFRAYDIRGIAMEQVTPQLAKLVGQALGSEAIELGEDTFIVARDARTHSPELTEWLVRGILSTGCNVLNIGTVPTPLLYFATSTLSESQKRRDCYCEP